MNIEGNSFTGTELIVLKYIQENPGCHLRKIKKEVQVSMGSLQYFLAKLENNGKITSQRKGLHKHYFPTGIFEENEKEILQFLTRETDREIIFTIIENVNPTQTDIKRALRISSSAINWHLRRLIDSEIIVEERDRKYKRYRLSSKVNSSYIGNLLKNYYPNIWDKWSNRLAEMFLSLSSSKKTKKQDEKNSEDK